MESDAVLLSLKRLVYPTLPLKTKTLGVFLCVLRLGRLRG